MYIQDKMIYRNLTNPLRVDDSLQVVDSDLNISRRISTDLALNGKESAIADILKSLEVCGEIYATRTKRNFFKVLNAPEVLRNRMNHLINKFGVAAIKHNAVLSVGVYDVISEVVNCANGIVTRNHNEVCGIKVYTDTASAAQRVKESLEGCGRLGTCLNCEMRADRVSILSESIARLLHDLVAVVSGILGNYADVGSNDIRFKILSKIKNSLRGFDKLGVKLGVTKAATEVTADRREAKTVVLYEL